MKKNNFRNISIVTCGCLVIFLITAILVKKHCTNYDYTDYYIHSSVISKVLKMDVATNANMPLYPVWHILTLIVSILLGKNVTLAAMIVTASLNVVSVLLVYKYFNKNKAGGIIPILTVLLFIIGPMYIPFYNIAIFEGQGSPNLWHNPTHICARTFSIIIWIMVVDLIDKHKNNQQIEKKEWILTSILLVIGELAKPSTIQIFIPGIGGFLLILLLKNLKDKYNWIFVKNMSLCCLPAILLLPAEFLISFSDDGAMSGGAVIAPFAYLSYFTPNIIISFILGYAFPIYVLIVFGKIIFDYEVLLALIMACAGYVEAIMFAETGERFIHGNFMWGHYLAMFIIYMVCAKKFFVDYTEIKKRKVLYYIGWGIFIIQLLVGIYYLDYLFTTNYTI